MEQKIYFNGKETTQEFIDDYIKENGGFMACKMRVEYNNGVVKYSTQTPQKIDMQIDDKEYKIDRLETIIYNMASYLNELYKNTEDDTFRHHKLIFGITKEEFNKYFRSK